MYSRFFDERLRLLTLFRAADVELHVVEAGGHINVQDVQTAAMECVHAAMDHIKKMAEIRRSREAPTEKKQKGHDLGRPPFGLTFNENSEYWVPDRESDEFNDALNVIELRENGVSWRNIEDETDVNTSTARRVWERPDRYLKEAETA